MRGKARSDKEIKTMVAVFPLASRRDTMEEEKTVVSVVRKWLAVIHKLPMAHVIGGKCPFCEEQKETPAETGAPSTTE